MSRERKPPSIGNDEIMAAMEKAAATLQDELDRPRGAGPYDADDGVLMRPGDEALEESDLEAWAAKRRGPKA